MSSVYNISLNDRLSIENLNFLLAKKSFKALRDFSIDIIFGGIPSIEEHLKVFFLENIVKRFPIYRRALKFRFSIKALFKVAHVQISFESYYIYRFIFIDNFLKLFLGYKSFKGLLSLESFQ